MVLMRWGLIPFWILFRESPLLSKLGHPGFAA
jgi:hypothetical protein